MVRIILASWLILAAVGPLASEAMVYLCGRGALPIDSLVALIGLVLKGLPYATAALCMAGVVGFALRREPLRAIASLAAAVIFLLVPLETRLLPTRDRFLLGYSARVKRQCESPDVRRWVADLLARAHDDADPMVAAAAPAVFSQYRWFRFVSIVPAGKAGARHVKISNGGHFVGFWGLRLGTAAYRCPEERYQFPISDGACVWWQDDAGGPYTWMPDN